MIAEGIRFEVVRHLAVKSGDDLVDGLLPRLLLVSLVVDCIKKVSQRLLDNLAKNLWKLAGAGRDGLILV